MLKYFHKNEVLVVFTILAIIFCQMFFSEYYDMLDEFTKNENNVVFKVQFQKYQEVYSLRYFKDYAMEYLDKVAPVAQTVDDIVVMTDDREYMAKNQDNLSGELYGVLTDGQTLDDLFQELDFAISLDEKYKNILIRYPNIVSISYISDNNFVYKWPKSTSSEYEYKYNEDFSYVANEEYVNMEEASTKSDFIESEINIFDKNNNYYGAIRYAYSADGMYKFLDDTYPCVIRDDAGRIIYSNINLEKFSIRDFSEIDKVFNATEKLNENGKVLVYKNKYYYIYTFADGTQLLQYMDIRWALLGALESTIPVILVGISYIIFLAYKDNYEQENEKLVEAMKELDDSYRKLKVMANTDFLTGIYNRAGFTGAINEMIENNVDMIFVMADIDKFKNINDTYGHEVGDNILKAFSQSLICNISEKDLICRWGGEEFIIVFTNISLDEAIQRTNCIREDVLQVEVLNNENDVVKMTASFGVAKHIAKNNHFLATITRADEALYYSKNNGRNKVTSFDML